jgi:hypothetical protein
MNFGKTEEKHCNSAQFTQNECGRNVVMLSRIVRGKPQNSWFPKKIPPKYKLNVLLLRQLAQ